MTITFFCYNFKCSRNYNKNLLYLWILAALIKKPHLEEGDAVTINLKTTQLYYRRRMVRKRDQHPPYFPLSIGIVFVVILWREWFFRF